MVMTSNRLYKSGEKITIRYRHTDNVGGQMVSQPAVVIKESTREQFIEQMEEMGMDLTMVLFCPYFYEFTTD
jgi:hypothetical protein